MPEPSDETLIASARQGNAHALESLIARHQDRVYRYAIKLCRNPDDAQEVLQETMLSLAKGLADFREEAALTTWLYTVARSHCIKLHRRSKFAPLELESLEADDAPTPSADARTDPEMATAAREVDEALQRAIDALDDTSREVLVLRDVEGLTATEVAKVMGTSSAAVKSRLHRARLTVRESMVPLLQPRVAPATTQPCPDALTLLSKDLEGEIDAMTCAELEAHLATCETCDDACQTLRKTLALCGAAQRSVAVPTAVQASVRVALREFLASA